MRPKACRHVRLAEAVNRRSGVRHNVRNKHVAGHHRRREVVHLRLHKHRRQQLHTDAVLRQLAADGQREITHIHFGRRVDGHVRQRLEVAARRHIDDGAAAAFFHAIDQHARHHRDGADIDVDNVPQQPVVNVGHLVGEVVVAADIVDCERIGVVLLICHRLPVMFSINA